MLCIIDKKHRIWIHDWSSNGKFHEVLRNDEYILKPNINQYLIDINEKFLCFTDCHEQLFIFSNCLTGKNKKKDLRKLKFLNIFLRNSLVISTKKYSFTTFNWCISK